MIVDDLEEIAEVAMSYMKPGETILDLGANDGTLLGCVREDFYRVGVEPANNLIKDLKENCDEAIHDFWEGYPEKVKVVTAIGMFYDLEEPLRFMKDVEACLVDDGIFIAQLMTAKHTFENNDIGNLCHEHLELYTYRSLVHLFEYAGLEIFKIEENDINGGSYRIFARKLKDGSIKYPEEKIDFGIFGRNLEETREKLKDYLKKAKAEGLRVYGYGASTKANTVLQYFGLGPDVIEGMADKDEAKWGRHTLTGIPIVSEEEARKRAQIFIAFPYGFLDYFKKREAWWLKEARNRFVLLTPNFQVTYD